MGFFIEKALPEHIISSKMRLQVYKPNAKSTGNAATFEVGYRDGKPEFYVSFIKQSGWDPKTKNGSFKGNKDDPSKNINMKLNEFELGEILNAFNRFLPWSGFHSFGGNNTSLLLSPWKKSKNVKLKAGNESIDVHAYGFSVFRSGTSFAIALEPGEIEVLKELIKYFYKVTFDKKAEDQKKYLQSRASYTPSKTTPVPAAKVEPKVEPKSQAIAEEEVPF